MKPNSIKSKDYDLHFFGQATGSTPQSIIRLDNNREILIACRIGKTREQLKTNNIEATQSQIRLLRDWRLLQGEDEILRTGFPILDSSETECLRKATREAALIIGSGSEGEVHALKEVLRSEGYEKSSFTILFSYVLDDLVWDEMEEAGRILERKITIEKPFWAGFLWAICPPREFSCGTNSSTNQGAGLYLNWSKIGRKLVFSVYSDRDAYSYLLEDILKHGKVKNEKAITVFKDYSIFDSKGDLTIPVIVENTSNNLYRLCKMLAQKVAEQVVNALDIENLESELHIKDRGETMAVAYHEIMWDLLDYFESQRVIQKPVVFANPEKAELKNVADLMFVVKQTED